MQEFMNVYQDFYVLDFNNHPFFAGLILAVIVDVALGFGKAWATKTFISEKARTGLVAHVSLLTIGMILYPQMSILGFAVVADTFISFFILAYVASIAGNLKAMGVPIPDKWLTRLNEEIDKKKEK